MSLRSSLILATGLALIAPSASAFCRATTCNPADPSENCQRDDERCLITGEPLFWSSSCVSFSVQADGSRPP